MVWSTHPMQGSYHHSGASLQHAYDMLAAFLCRVPPPSPLTAHDLLQSHRSTAMPPIVSPSTRTSASATTDSRASATASRAGATASRTSAAASAAAPAAALSRSAARSMPRRAASAPALNDERIRRENMAMRQRLQDVKPRARSLANTNDSVARVNSAPTPRARTPVRDTPVRAPPDQDTPARAQTQVQPAAQADTPSPSPSASRSRRVPPQAPSRSTAATPTPTLPVRAYVPRPRRHVTPVLNDPRITQANLELRQRILEAKPIAKASVRYQEPRPQVQQPQSNADGRMATRHVNTETTIHVVTPDASPQRGPQRGRQTPPVRSEVDEENRLGGEAEHNLVTFLESEIVRLRI